MKLREENVVIEKSDDFVESMFGISEKDSAHILNILRDKLYSDKILAVIREYCTNAQDAHIEAGKSDIPIEVSLPSQLDLTFSVRDFGPGLSEEDIRNVYAMYGASTKRQSNAVVGMLGLGCKAAFAYSDAFTIVSWNNGKKKSYSAYIDETKRGKIALLTTEDSSEPDGIEIKIPAKIQDCRDFANKAKDLLKFFTPIPIVHGVEIEKPIYDIEGVLENGVRYGVPKRTNLWSNSDEGKVIMGGVPYKLDTDTFRGIPSANMHIYVEIGDVDVAAHRETLEYTDHTNRNIYKYIKKIKDSIIENLNNKIKNAETYLEANNIHAEFQRNNNWHHTLVVYNQWKGHALNKDFLKTTTTCTLQCLTVSCGVQRWQKCNSISAYQHKDRVVFELDEGGRWKNKIKLYMQWKKLDYKNVCAISWNTNDQEKIQEYKDQYHLDEMNIIPVSKCVLPQYFIDELKALRKMEKELRPATERSISHIGKVFKVKKDILYQDPVPSLNWDKVDKAPSGTKYYVPLHRFKSSMSGKPYLDAKELGVVFRVANFLDIKADELYGVKEKYVENLDSTWVNIIDVLVPRLKQSDYIKNLRVGNYITRTIPTATREMACFIDVFPKNTIAYELLDATAKIEKQQLALENHTNEIRQCVRWFDIQADEYSSKVNIPEIVEMARIKYKLTELTDTFPGTSYSYYNKSKTADKEKLAASIAEYVRLIEGVKENDTQTICTN